jgi:hypothetical protein
MNAKTLKALKQSIAHWRRLATGKTKRGEKPSGHYCPLCKLFPGPCEGCPVMAETKQSDCWGSPWGEANWNYFNIGKRSGAFKAAAREELAFLKSLLPKRKHPTR